MWIFKKMLLLLFLICCYEILLLVPLVDGSIPKDLDSCIGTNDLNMLLDTGFKKLQKMFWDLSFAVQVLVTAASAVQLNGDRLL